ncbi:hypothetical protein [Aurantiacibacter flavus]|uniref:Uncharacterized protein n=1 Tax=Aurantiacibacter flavus TaxID=3145232 RepID=A0ABV0D0M4_9SPHN
MSTRREVIETGLGVIGSMALADREAHAAPVYRIPEGLAAPGDLLRQLDEDLRIHASFGSKISGGKGDLDAARWIAQRLDSLGMEVRKLDFSVPSFLADVAEVRTPEIVVPVFPQPVVVPTRVGGLRAHGALMRDEFHAPQVAGKIAFIDLPHARHAALFNPPVMPLVQAAVRAGAQAIVLVTNGPTGEVIALNTKLDPLVDVPLALIAPKDFPPVSKAIAEEQLLEIELVGDASDATSCNIIATRRAGPKWLAFSTPRSGWFQAVGERAPGTAAFLELVRWASVRFPDHSIFAMNNGGHEFDFKGSHLALAEAPPAQDTVIWTHLGAGLATRDRLGLGVRQLGMMDTADPRRVLMASGEMLDTCRRAFADISGYKDPLEILGGAGELSTFIDHGYRRAFAGLGVHRWCHVPGDGIETVDAGLLLPVVEAHRAVIEETVGRFGIA